MRSPSNAIWKKAPQPDKHHLNKCRYGGKSLAYFATLKYLRFSSDDEGWLLPFQKDEVKAPPGCALDVGMRESYQIIKNKRAKEMGNIVYSSLLNSQCLCLIIKHSG